MVKAPKEDHGERTPAETPKVRDATLKRMLVTKPTPHAKATKGKSKRDR